MAYIGMVVGEFLRLGRDCVGDFGASITGVYAVKTGESIEKPDPVPVGDVDAFAAGDDAVIHFAAGELAEMGRGMHEMGAVPFGELVVKQNKVTPI